MDARAVAEAAAVAEHIASLSAAAAAFRLSADVPSRRGQDGAESTVPLLDEAGAGEASATLREIRDWAGHALGIAHAPAIWRALAQDPQLLETTWRKDRVVLGAGVLDELVKGCAALAVAELRQSDYWIAYLSQYLRTRCGADDRLLVEVAGSAMHYVAFNTIAHAMRLEAPFADMEAADVAPGGRLERFVSGVRQPATAQPPEAGSR